MTAYGLIDTTEMYLRTLFELEEEGIPPLRARIVERLSQSGPTVSQTVARMERDDLVRVEDDRRLVLTPAGQALAIDATSYIQSPASLFTSEIIRLGKRRPG